MSANGWDQWKNAVLSDLREVKQDLKDHREESAKLWAKVSADIAVLKAKSTLWWTTLTLLAGAVGAVAARLL